MTRFNQLIAPPLEFIAFSDFRKRLRGLLLVSFIVFSSIPGNTQITVENLTGCDWNVSFTAAQRSGCKNPVSNLSPGIAYANQTSVFFFPAPYNNALIWWAVACKITLGGGDEIEVGCYPGYPNFPNCNCYHQDKMVTDCGANGTVVHIKWIDEHNVEIYP